MNDYDRWAEIYDEFCQDFNEDLNFYYSEAEVSRQPILELACGTGRLTIALACAGMKVVGLDSSDAMLDKAKEKLKSIGRVKGNIRFEKGLMQKFKMSEKFGLVIVPSKSFQHLITPEYQTSCLTCIYDHLKNQGKLIIDIFNPNLKRIANTDTRERFFAKEYKNSTGNKIMAWDMPQYDILNQTLQDLIELEELDEEGILVNKQYFNLKLRYIFRYEMQHLLEKCGFKIKALYGSYQKNKFTKDSRDMIWVAEK